MNDQVLITNLVSALRDMIDFVERLDNPTDNLLKKPFTESAIWIHAKEFQSLGDAYLSYKRQAERLSNKS